MKPSFRIRPSIILFGDSITEQAFGLDGKVGWASLLGSDYSRRADVLNRGFSGYTTRLGIDLLPRVFAGPPQHEDCLFCTVFFGANDSALPGEMQHVPIEEYGENIVKIVEHIRGTFQSTSFPILLITPPPFDAQAWMASRQVDTPGRDNMIAKSYGDKLKQVCDKLEMCSVVDTWTALEGPTDAKIKYLSDGLHLNEAGNKLVHKAIVDVLAKDYPDILPMRDGEGRHGKSGVALEEPLWRELLLKDT